ncbi:hypothetical protein RHODGE_RHODGE_02951 [Rhodoplanes serenus]|uniref:DUF4062 domain-containing protein n=1 Tax=Rhodoplanes serenus TaxID=200615 RepID=A0A3S4CI43_9BRAD|nr:DUF4062 domain-containing protein [Rhodoplanes serenus]VCU09781.1 hypothetical protein RHODGE_RHODGE_02951 [Rhodoplanes serenus]
MPRTLTEYRVFIGSPGGLDEERKGFRATIDRFNEVHGNPTGVVFAAVGWEETLGGVGRPQEQINKDLRGCDYAVFVLHDRWGSPTGNGKTSGTEEEWDLALELYAARKIHNICLFFKELAPGKLRNPNRQLAKVLAFKAAIVAAHKHTFKLYAKTKEFCFNLEKHLGHWLRNHAARRSAGVAVALEALDAADRTAQTNKAPSYGYWLGEAKALLGTKKPEDALFCVERALALAATDLDWAEAENVRGIALHHLSDARGAVESFDAIVARLAGTAVLYEQVRLAIALVNKGISLDAFARSDEALVAYTDVVTRFGSRTELALKEQVTAALINKGAALGELRQSRSMTT